jgi:hypothetical protein
VVNPARVTNSSATTGSRPVLPEAATPELSPHQRALAAACRPRGREALRRANAAVAEAERVFPAVPSAAHPARRAPAPRAAARSTINDQRRPAEAAVGLWVTLLNSSRLCRKDMSSSRMRPPRV